MAMPRRLERSYAVSNIDVHVDEAYSNDEAPTEHDDEAPTENEDLEYVEEGGNENDVEYITDSDPTPKKKRKSNVGGQVSVPHPATKPSMPDTGKDRLDLKTKAKKKTVRDQVDERREKPGGYGKNMVSA